MKYILFVSFGFQINFNLVRLFKIAFADSEVVRVGAELPELDLRNPSEGDRHPQADGIPLHRHLIRMVRHYFFSFYLFYSNKNLMFFVYGSLLLPICNSFLFICLKCKRCQDKYVKNG